MSTDPIIALALAGGAVLAYRATEHGDEPVKAKGLPTVTSSGITAAVASLKDQMSKVALVVKPQSTFQAEKKGSSVPAAAEKAMLDKAKAEWSKLSADAKAKACESLKKANPGSSAIQALDCSKSNFDNVMKACAAAGGTAACAASGAGVVVSPLCGIAAGWIAGWAGPKFKEWASDAYSGLKGAGSAVVSGAKAVIPFW